MELIGYSSDGLYVPKALQNKKVFGRKCCYCNVKLTLTNYTREHIIPKSRGGNITVSCCRQCNLDRGDKTYQQFMHWVIYKSGYTIGKKSIMIRKINQYFDIYGNV